MILLLLPYLYAKVRNLVPGMAVPISGLPIIQLAPVKCWGTQSSLSYLLPSDLSLAELPPAPADAFLTLNH